MPDPIDTRADLLEAMASLHEAHAALVAQDLRTAGTKLALAEAIVADVRKKISPAAAGTYELPST